MTSTSFVYGLLTGGFGESIGEIINNPIIPQVWNVLTNSVQP